MATRVEASSPVAESRSGPPRCARDFNANGSAAAASRTCATLSVHPGNTSPASARASHSGQSSTFRETCRGRRAAAEPVLRVTATSVVDKLNCGAA
ncbi:hypothetical protein MRX96_009292 [Rhipicephalus microplus]